jgi:hypothetical protein
MYERMGSARSPEHDFRAFEALHADAGGGDVMGIAHRLDLTV